LDYRIPLEIRMMPRFAVLCVALQLVSSVLAADTVDPKRVAQWLETPVLEPGTTLQETQAYCRSKVRPWAEYNTVAEWETAARQIRADVLEHVVFRGAAKTWRDAQLGVELFDTIPCDGYAIQKLSYEALPGLWIPALLYVPDKLVGKVPVAMHVNGHDRNGKAADYKQLRSIHLARQGVIVLNAEWLGMGQLHTPNFGHYKMNQLDVCGTSGLAPFYLAMSRGLDVLLAHKHADPARVAVAGLSGGGWQTIVISSLDERVTLANPVAGYSSFLTRVGVSADLGDSEQTPVDLGKYADYLHLTALRAPRPTLLTYNAKDNCCFVAGTALPPLLEVAGPLYKLYGKPDALRSHINEDPGDHNFGLDNRRAYYRMLADHFFADQPFSADEAAELAKEVKTAEELNVPLPEGNADFHTLALKLAETLPRSAEVPKSEQEFTVWRTAFVQTLKSEILHCPTGTLRSFDKAPETVDGVTIIRHRLRFADHWTLPVIEFTRAQPKSTTIVIADGGRKSASESIAKRLDQGERVIVCDLWYFGESALGPQDFLYGLLMSTVGERPLGLQVAQVAAVTEWAEQNGQPIRLESFGPRTSLIALCAAITSEKVSDVQTHDGLSSLKDVLTQNKAVNEAPELFTFGLLEFTDIPQLKAAFKKPVK